MLIVILGKLGSGKTFIMTLLALFYKREIWSNYEIHIPNYRKLDIIDLFNLKDNIVLLMDEAYSWIESRNSNSSINEYISSILYHTRKTFTDIYLTTPMLSTIDKRFRKTANFIIYCRYRNPYSKENFHFLFYNKDNNTYTNQTILYSKAEKYFKLYNTYEKIESHRKKGLEYKLLRKYPDKLKIYVIELVNIVESKLERITHDSVKDCLLMEGIDLAYEPLIYIRLKGKKLADNKNR